MTDVTAPQNQLVTAAGSETPRSDSRHLRADRDETRDRTETNRDRSELTEVEKANLNVSGGHSFIDPPHGCGERVGLSMVCMLNADMDTLVYRSALKRSEVPVRPVVRAPIRRAQRSSIQRLVLGG